ncbi:MAG: carbohydrate ABC transporter permease [Candidatus Baldrarchaeota archaeon]
MKVKISTIVAHVVALLIGVVWILPVVSIFMVAIRPIREILHGWWNFKEFHPTLKNFVEALNHPTTPLGRGLLNSFIIASLAMITPVFIAALAAYAFARFSFPIKTYLFLTIIIMMAMPQQMVAIPLFQIMIKLGLINTYLGLILVHTAWGLPWIILFLRNFFLTLPIEVEEAARVDGASDFQIFLRIVLPMSLPALLSVTALQFTWVWNDFFLALLIIYSPDKLVATQRIVWMKGKYHTPWDTLCAGAVLVMIVPVLVYAILQKYYVKGMVGWVIKG